MGVECVDMSPTSCFCLHPSHAKDAAMQIRHLTADHSAWAANLERRGGGGGGGGAAGGGFEGGKGKCV